MQTQKRSIHIEDILINKSDSQGDQFTTNTRMKQKSPLNFYHIKYKVPKINEKTEFEYMYSKDSFLLQTEIFELCIDVTGEHFRLGDCIICVRRMTFHSILLGFFFF